MLSKYKELVEFFKHSCRGFIVNGKTAEHLEGIWKELCEQSKRK